MAVDADLLGGGGVNLYSRDVNLLTLVRQNVVFDAFGAKKAQWKKKFSIRAPDVSHMIKAIKSS